MNQRHHINRHVERRQRPDGKLDVVVVFFTGGPSDPVVTQEHVLYERVGPRQATRLIDTLEDVLASTYIQGRRNATS